MRKARSSPRMALAFAALGFLMLISGAAGALSLAAGFFGGGVSLLAAALLYFHFRLAKPSTAVIGSWKVAAGSNGSSQCVVSAGTKHCCCRDHGVGILHPDLGEFLSKRCA